MATRSLFKTLALLVVAPAALLVAGTVSAGAQVHVVQPGETLSGIANRYGLTVDELAASNDLLDIDLIYVGDALHIGVTGAAFDENSYVVVEGDTLTSLAVRYGLSWEALATANGITEYDIIWVGQLLVIPGAGAAQEGGGSSTASLEVREILRQAEVDHGLPSGLLQALSWQESGWQQDIVSSAGAVGVTQLLPSTASWVNEYLHPTATNWTASAYDNAQVGAALLAHNIWVADGDTWLALAAYYQGWASIEQYGLFDDTQQYVANVLFLATEFA